MKKNTCIVILVVVLLAISIPLISENVFRASELRSYVLDGNKELIMQYFTAEGSQIYSIRLQLWGSGFGATLKMYDSNENLVFSAGRGQFIYAMPTWMGFSSSWHGGYPIDVIEGEQYKLVVTFDRVCCNVMYDTEEMGGYVYENQTWIPINGGWRFNISYEPAPTYTADVTLIYPPDGASGINFPVMVQFQINTTAPSPYYTIVFKTTLNGSPYEFTVPYTPVPSDGQVSYLLKDEDFNRDCWVKWHVSVYQGYSKLLWTNFDDPWEFGISGGQPPPPPDWIDSYYYLNYMLPDSMDTTIYPEVDDWHGPEGYWYINKDNGHLIFHKDYNDENWLIDLYPTLNNVKFWRNKIIETTQIPYAVAQDSIDMIGVVYQNKPPVADFTYSPSSPVANQTVTFDASASYDLDGYIAGYTWNFGDGQWVSGPNEVVVSHTYDNGGIYTVTLEVQDNLGRTNSVSKSITVSGIYTLYLSIVPQEAGTVALSPFSADHKYPEGTVVTLTATPSQGYVFDHWEGDAIGSAKTTTVTMDSNKYVTAVFSHAPPQKYTLTIDVYPPEGGWVDVTPSGNVYDAGTVVTLTAYAKSGYVFDHWEGDAIGDDTTITLTMDSDKQVTAVFRKTVFATGYALIIAGVTIAIAGGIYLWRRR